jgi:hypothetical protein
MKKIVLLVVAVVGLTAASVRAQAVTVYDTLSATPLFGFSRVLTDNLVAGDQLHLSQAGVAQTIGATVYNGSAAGALAITGTMAFNIYDNTVPYSSGPITNPLIGSFTTNLDFSGFSGGGLNGGGFFTTFTVNVAALNFNLPQDIIITQQYTQLTGTATNIGVVGFQDSVVPGSSSPETVFLSSSTLGAGLYTFTGQTFNQFGYSVSVVPVPEPASLALVAVGAFGFGWRRLRKK